MKLVQICILRGRRSSQELFIKVVVELQLDAGLNDKIDEVKKRV